MDFSNMNINVIDEVTNKHNEEVILFMIEGFVYEMIMGKNAEGSFYPRNVYHSNKSIKTERCSLCNYTKLLHCMPLHLRAEKLFQHLREFPAIRLHWVGKDHV